MTFDTPDFFEDGEVFSFSLAPEAPALSPAGTPGSFADITDDEEQLIRTPHVDAITRDDDYNDDELFALDSELQLLPSSYEVCHMPSKAPVPRSYMAAAPADDEFANAARDNYRLWLAGV